MERFEERDSVVLKNDNQKIFGVLHRPLKSENYPVVLVCHGLGGHKTGKYRLYVHLAQLLTKIGIGCLRIDFRGSGDSEGDFSEMTIETEVSDAMVALDFLKKDSRIDSSRIGLFGRSFGGVIAVQAASLFKNIKSLALWAPVFSGDQWRDNWKLLQAQKLDAENQDRLMRINGQLPSRTFYEQLFGLQMKPFLTNLNNLPFLHIHGGMDEIVNLTHADGYQTLRHNAKGPTKFLRLQNCDHDFSHPIEQKIALQETASWFQHTLSDKGEK